MPAKALTRDPMLRGQSLTQHRRSGALTRRQLKPFQQQVSGIIDDSTRERLGYAHGTRTGMHTR